jgi:hypothetical protein
MSIYDEIDLLEEVLMSYGSYSKENEYEEPVFFYRLDT